MATLLQKPVRRELNRVRATKNGRLEFPDANNYITESARPVIVTLHETDMIEFRIKKTQRSYKMHLLTTMGVAQALTIYQHYERRCEQYKKDRSIGLKTRKPKMPKNLPLGNYLRKVLRAIL